MVNSMTELTTTAWKWNSWVCAWFIDFVKGSH